MAQQLNRLNDVFFKYLLGDAKKKFLTLSFINGILNRTDDTLFTDLEFLDKEMTPIMQDGKVSVLDIRAKMNDGTQVNIEVQVCKDPDMARRSLYYWAKMYGSELREGEPYDKLMPAISINLMDFNAFAQYTACHHSYHICNDETKDILIDDLEMHFIELEKIRIGDIRKLRKSERWIAYFSHQCSDEEREVLAMSEPAIKEAMKCEMYFTQDEKLRRKYEIQEKARRDYISMMHNIEKSRTEGWQKGLEEGRAEGLAEGREEGRAEGRKEGRAEGRKEGREEGRLEERKRFTEQTVATMLQEGLSHELIARIMNLPIETIQAIAAAQPAPAAE
ncbi:Rpn family recombination-promoting nuclease/putative transposase [Megasphaera stantonii]|uniref:Rpn family recombination-promoting nuclease/putative transposase n=1 Tax=Megasphaera stantonii TaxID=2144175 RepID=UPI002943DBB6|nr:Rpn family recombination-promoting nuclease/putative transposase [Megasphaera stantonii]